MVNVYGYKKCSTVMKSIKYLKAKDYEVTFFDFVANKISKEILESLIDKADVDINLFFNTNGKVYKELGLKEKIDSLSYDEKLNYLLSDGLLIKRPIIEFDNKVFIGFKEKDLENYLGN